MQWKSRNKPYVPYNDSYRWELVKQINNTPSQAPVGAEQFGISLWAPLGRRPIYQQVFGVSCLTRCRVIATSNMGTATQKAGGKNGLENFAHKLARTKTKFLDALSYF